MQKVKLYESRRLTALFGALAAALMIVIFLFSAESAAESADRSTGIAEVILSVILPDFEDLAPARQEELLSATDHFLRKTAHFCVYAALGALLCLTSLGFAASRSIHVLRSLLIGAVYAAGDEWHQAFVPGRGPAVTDVLLDSAGVLTGALCALLLTHLILKKKNRC